MTWAKICGLTNQSDAEWAIECGADALGFIREPSSARYISPSNLDWIGALEFSGPKVEVYGELPDHHSDEGPFDAFQTTSVICFDLMPGCRPPYYILSVRLKHDDDPEDVANTPYCRHLLLDAFSPHAHGGTGEKVDWDLAAEVVRLYDGEVILAGGLSPENVAEAVQIVKPFGVDVSTGTESRKGIKDRGLVKAFLEAAKST